MEILTFKIVGKLAHFRKYYANNTAMTFSIPPRTCVMGIIASAMGMARDSYYESFASENLQIGIRVLKPLRKSFHRLNLLSIKSLGDISRNWSSDFRGTGGRIQTPFEIVSPFNIRDGELVYQIFVAPRQAGIKTFELIKDRFLFKQPVFNITLGTANFTACFDAIELADATSIVQDSSSEFISIHSAIPTKLVEKVAFGNDDENIDAFIEEDMMPGDFVANSNREVRKMNRVLFSTSAAPLHVKLNTFCYQVSLKNETIRLQFVDS